MRRFVVGVLVLCSLLVGRLALADEVVNIVHVRCSVSKDSLAISHFHVIEGEAPGRHVKALPEILEKARVQFGEETYYNPFRTEVVKEIPEKMVAHAPITQVCDLPSGSVRIVLGYGALSVGGLCGVSPGARLSIFKDGKPLFKEIWFDNDCLSHVSVHHVTYENGSWQFCGGGFDTEEIEYCIKPAAYGGEDVESALRKKRDELMKQR